MQIGAQSISHFNHGGVPEQGVADGKGSVSSSCCGLSVRVSVYLWLLSLICHR
jgi:hypothetical protein